MTRWSTVALVAVLVAGPLVAADLALTRGWWKFVAGIALAAGAVAIAAVTNRKVER